jgi:hypothetical protein
MTVASKWYDEPSRCAREYEMHFKAARTGKVRAVRRHLAKRGIPYFQRMIYRRFKRWIPKRQIRASFEREEVAMRTECVMTIETRSMQYRGRDWKAFPYPSRVLSYAKKKRTASKRKRA